MKKIKTSSGVIKYNPEPTYWGVSQIDKKVATENIFIVKDILDANHVTFGLLAGTLLGAIREHDFIDHDEDIDLYLKSEDRQRVIDLLPLFMKKGFKVSRYHKTKKVLSIIRNNQYVDFNFFAPYNDDIRCCMGWLVLNRFYDNMDEIEFLGKKFMAPKDSEGYLECAYGRNWRTPIKWNNYEMPKWKIQLIEFADKLKQLLPYPMFMYLNRIKANMEIEKHLRYITRYCNDNGVPLVNLKQKYLYK